MIFTIQKTLEHRTVSTEVPGLPAIGCITGAGYDFTERFTLKGICDEITFDMSTSLLL
jgi:hypothetical protein